MSVMTVQIFVNITRMSKKVEIHQYVFTEAEAAMEKVLREIERSTIDYEEYYSHLVLGNAEYGVDYGAYGAEFYDPGVDGPAGFDLNTLIAEPFYGVCCDDGCASEYHSSIASCTAGYEYDSYDAATYVHPYDADYNNSGQYLAENALCEVGPCGDVDNAHQDELYLIDGDGVRKVIFALEDKADAEGVLSMIEMEGVDEDGDGISDYWQCSSDYTCTDTNKVYEVDGIAWRKLTIPNGADLTNGNENDDDFEPVSPSSLSVLDLNFFITPFEDPYRADGEGHPSVQQHPHVIVTMTFAPADDLTKGYLGEDWTLTIQGTASAGVFDEVESEYRGYWRWE